MTDKLNAIRRTFLFCNSLREFALKTGIPSIEDNNNFDKVGADKKYAVISTFENELKEIAQDNTASLKNFLDEYALTSEFYVNEDLRRKKYLCNQDSVLSIVESIYFTHVLPEDRKLAKLVDMLYDPESDRLKIPGINIAILALMLLKIIPGYNSRNGEVEDIGNDYSRVCSLIDQFYLNANIECNLFRKNIEDKIKEGKIRLNRVCIIEVLDVCMNNVDFSRNHRHELHELYRYYNIDGLWVESGKDQPTVFYNIYFNGMTYNMEMVDISKRPVQYILFGVETIYDEYEAKIEFITAHPRGRTRLVQGKAVGVLDYSVHNLELLDEFGNPDFENPVMLKLTDVYVHPNYDFHVKMLHKASESLDKLFESTVTSCECCDRYANYRTVYDVGTCILAITQNHIYVKARENNFVYRIDKEKYEYKNISSVRIDSPAGIATVASDGPYIGFESIGLYIDVKDENTLHNKGVKKIYLTDEFLDLLES